MGISAYELDITMEALPSDLGFDSVNPVSYCRAWTPARADYRLAPACSSLSTVAEMVTHMLDRDLQAAHTSSYRASMRYLVSDMVRVKRLGLSVARGLEQQANPLLGVLPRRQFRISVSCRPCTARYTTLHAAPARTSFDKLRMTEDWLREFFVLC